MGAFKLRGYVVERFLGRGATGEVWQARVAATGARVALKRIAGAGDERRLRATSEAALLSALEHPNLVRLHGLVPADDAMVLVQDLADGGSLAGLLDARGRLTPGEVITAVAPIAAALAYLHGEGVVHGDVSAANILFTATGVSLLADVGVARLTGDDADAEATPAYVDPAVAAGCVPGPQSDVFMLAGVALHALTGAPPWRGVSVTATLAQAASGVLDDVPERLAAAGVAPEMAAVLCRALALDPHRRGTAADLALDLRHSGQPVAVELAAGVRGADPQLASPPGPRHAALPGRAAGSRTRAAAEPRDPARPAFARPVSTERAGAPPPTRMVAPRPRPVIPRPARRRVRPRALALAGALGLASVLATVGTLWSRADGQGERPATNARPQVESVHRTRSAASPAPGSAADTPAAGTAAESGWPGELARLDALRAQAFATRNADLLRRVYVPGPLLQADAALLERIVPAGCGLTGVHTRYRVVRASEHRTGVVVTAVAELGASQLVCGGQPNGRAAGTGPTPLRLVLVRTQDGLRIASEHQ